MRCSKCGGEIKNLPDYIEEIGIETLCTRCVGYSQQGSLAIIPDRFRTLSELSYSDEEFETAA